MYRKRRYLNKKLEAARKEREWQRLDSPAPEIA